MKWPNLVQKVSAQEFNFTDGVYESVGWETTGKNVTVAGFIEPFLYVLYGIAGLILLINIVLAGLKIATQAKKGLEEAKKNLLNSIIGLTIIMLATVITNILAGFFK